MLFMQERTERTSVTINISEDTLKRAIELLRKDGRTTYERMDPRTRELLEQIERSQIFDHRDYGIIVY